MLWPPWPRRTTTVLFPPRSPQAVLRKHPWVPRVDTLAVLHGWNPPAEAFPHPPPPQLTHECSVSKWAEALPGPKGHGQHLFMGPKPNSSKSPLRTYLFETRPRERDSFLHLQRVDTPPHPPAIQAAVGKQAGLQRSLPGGCLHTFSSRSRDDTSKKQDGTEHAPFVQRARNTPPPGFVSEQ